MKSNQIKTTTKRTRRAAEIVFPWDLRWANPLVIQYGMVCPENIHANKIITTILRCFLGRVYVRLWCTFRCIYISLITRKCKVVRKTRCYHLSHQDLPIALRSRLNSVNSMECSLCGMYRKDGTRTLGLLRHWFTSARLRGLEAEMLQSCNLTSALAALLTRMYAWSKLQKQVALLKTDCRVYSDAQPGFIYESHHVTIRTLIYIKMFQDYFSKKTYWITSVTYFKTSNKVL